MPTIPDSFAQLQYFISSVSGHTCINTVGADLVSVPTVAQMNAAYDELEAAYDDQLNGSSASTGLRAVVNDGGTMIEVLSTNPAGAGTRGGSLATPQVQTLIKKNTALIGRKHRGRIYIPDVLESDVSDNGTVAAAELTILSAIAAAWMSALSTGPFVAPVILHEDATAPTEITSMVPETKCATQRRRFER